MVIPSRGTGLFAISVSILPVSNASRENRQATAGDERLTAGSRAAEAARTMRSRRTGTSSLRDQPFLEENSLLVGRIIEPAEFTISEFGIKFWRLE
jgi:hypothetical protein